jgi:hypothetical protein
VEELAVTRAVPLLVFAASVGLPRSGRAEEPEAADPLRACAERLGAVKQAMAATQALLADGRVADFANEDGPCTSLEAGGDAGRRGGSRLSAGLCLHASDKELFWAYNVPVRTDGRWGRYEDRHARSGRQRLARLIRGLSAAVQWKQEGHPPALAQWRVPIVWWHTAEGGWQLRPRNQRMLEAALDECARAADHASPPRAAN